MLYTFGAYAMAAFYLGAGATHFLRPRFFERIVPLWMPSPTLLVYTSGLVEVVCALLLLSPATRAWGAWGLIVMLVTYFVVHINMAVTPGANLGLPQWVLWGRVAAQFLLIAWAWVYTGWAR